MKASPWLRWLLAVMAISALALFAACGGDDDDDGGNDNGSNNDDQNDEPTEEGNDDDDSGGGGSDEEEYVASICAAFGDFGEAFQTIITDPENQDASEEEALALFEEPFESLLDAMQDADPPGDIEDFHEALVTNLEDSLDKIREGDIEAFEEVSALEIPTPDADVEAKYQAIADENPDCAEAGLTFD